MPQQRQQQHSVTKSLQKQKRFQSSLCVCVCVSSVEKRAGKASTQSGDKQLFFSYISFFPLFLLFSRFIVCFCFSAIAEFSLHNSLKMPGRVAVVKLNCRWAGQPCPPKPQVPSLARCEKPIWNCINNRPKLNDNKGHKLLSLLRYI